MNKRSIGLIILISFFYTYMAAAQKRSPAVEKGIVKISFVNTVHGTPLVLNDSLYENPFYEKYNIRRLKYYISNVQAKNSRKLQKEKDSYHLVNAADSASLSFSFSLEAGDYNSISFLLGVDSLHNCSGAQTGALDPMNDMFWTWNSGYVMLKLEGNSSASLQPDKRFEYHIGGYAGLNNVIKMITLSSAFNINSGKTTEIIIEADINTIWKQPNDIQIAKIPVCTTPGILSQQVAANYSNMFSIKKSIQPY
jgi:hypothetical protein